MLMLMFSTCEERDKAEDGSDGRPRLQCSSGRTEKNLRQRLKLIFFQFCYNIYIYFSYNV
jgi:hypothetical protein